MNEYIFKKAMEIYNGETTGLIRRCYKTLAVALNEQFGFGKKRLMQLFDKTSDITMLREKDEIYWHHIDDVIIKQIKLEFERENYDNLDK